MGASEWVQKAADFMQSEEMGAICSRYPEVEEYLMREEFDNLSVADKACIFLAGYIGELKHVSE